MITIVYCRSNTPVRRGRTLRAALAESQIIGLCRLDEKNEILYAVISCCSITAAMVDLSKYMV